MRALDPTGDEYWALKPERNALRDGIDILWLEEHGYGARCGRWASLPWPEDVRGRWRVLREYVETFCDTRMGDIVPATYESERTRAVEQELGPIGESLRQWIAFLDELIATDQWIGVFRDVQAWEGVNRRYYSIIQQAEGDYHWVLTQDQAAAADPPIYGLGLDYDAGVFRFDRTPLDDAAYGSWPRLTDFARILIDSYQRTPIGWPGSRLEEAQPTTANTMFKDNSRRYGSPPPVWGAPEAQHIEPPADEARDREDDFEDEDDFDDEDDAKDNDEDEA